MKMFALVEPSGRVAQLESEDGRFEVAEPFVWVEAPPSVKVDWTYAEGAFSAPVLLPSGVSRVTMRQARLALLQAGKLNAVAAAIASLPSPQKETAQIEWDYSAFVERGSDIVALLGPALGLDEAALDALFLQAAGL